MLRPHQAFVPAILAALLTLGIAVGVAMAGPPSSATARFGNPTAAGGSNCLQGESCKNAQDNMIPRTVVISDEGTVTFEVARTHHVVVYPPGTSRDAIGPAGPGAFMNDTTPAPYANQYGFPTPFANPGAIPAANFTVTFTEPGKYLVVCNVRGHFQDFGMYGWVDVK
jgi:hypothetical protein